MISEFFRRSVATSMTLLLAACTATMPPTPSMVHQPTTVRPAPEPVALPANGTIYQPGSAGQPGYPPRALFEDRRASAVGDILTININETTAASKKSGSTAARTSGNNTSVSALVGLPGRGLEGMNLGTKSASSFNGKGDSASNNAFTGTISVTVIEVLPSGNLVVSGEKQIGINQGAEFVRFSGVVSPSRIAVGNVVSSTQVADMRVEYRGNGYLDEAQTMGWFQRALLSLNPF